MIGRKTAVLVVPTVSVLQNIVFLICSFYLDSSVIYLCLGNSLAALFGEFPGVMALCYGFIADVTISQNLSSRISRMAFIDCAVNFAGIPAGLFAGQLLNQVGFPAVFGLSIGVNVILLSYIVFFIPSRKAIVKMQAIQKISSQNEKEISDHTNAKVRKEISSTEKPSSDPKPYKLSTRSEELKTEENTIGNKPINWDLFKPHKQIYLVWKLITCKERRHLILPPLIAFVFIIYGFVGDLTITSLYLKSKPLSLSPDYIGYYYATQATIRGVGVILTTQIAKRLLKVTDINLLLFGVFSQIVCHVLIGCSNGTLFVFLANITGFAIPVGLSLSRSYTSKQVPPEQVGTLMAAFESIDALSFTTNLISIEVFNATLNSFSGSVFIFLAGFAFVGFCITFGNKIYLSRINTTPQDQNMNNFPDSVITNKAVTDA